MEYNIKKLRSDRNYFDEFKSELPSEFKKHARNVDEFIKYFDLKNTSREIYYSDIARNATDEEIYNEFEKDHIELKAYSQVDGIGYKIRLHGICYLEDYDTDDEMYYSQSFEDFNAIELL